jgi:protein-disulfide isomerase
MWKKLIYGLFALLAVVLSYQAFNMLGHSQQQNENKPVGEKSRAIDAEHVQAEPRPSNMQTSPAQRLSRSDRRQKALHIRADDLVLGNVNAPLTIIEYSSYACPVCVKYHQKIFKLLKKDFIDTAKVRYIIRDMPSTRAALAGSMVALCAPPERRYEVVEALFDTQSSWVYTMRYKERLAHILSLMGIELDVDNCLENEVIEDQILKYAYEDVKAINIEGTPAIIINGAPIYGLIGYDTLKAKIDAELRNLTQ